MEGTELGMRQSLSATQLAFWWPELIILQGKKIIAFQSKVIVFIRYFVYVSLGLPWWLSGKESACQCRRPRFDPWVGKIPWRREWQPTPVFLPGESHGQGSLAGYSPWGRKESDMTWRLNSNTNMSSVSPLFLPPVLTEHFLTELLM